jgi:hypothetical protein
MGTQAIRIPTFGLILVVSFVFAGLSCGAHFLMDPAREDLRFDYSAAFSAAWGLSALYAILRYRKRGLWVLVGLPFALLWPLVYLGIVLACRWGDCI